MENDKLYKLNKLLTKVGAVHETNVIVAANVLLNRFSSMTKMEYNVFNVVELIFLLQSYNIPFDACRDTLIQCMYLGIFNRNNNTKGDTQEEETPEEETPEEETQEEEIFVFDKPTLKLYKHFESALTQEGIHELSTIMKNHNVRGGIHHNQWISIY